MNIMLSPEKCNTDNPYDYCDRCEEKMYEDELQEYSWRNADHDKMCMFICEKCIEKINEGDI